MSDEPNQSAMADEWAAALAEQENAGGAVTAEAERVSDASHLFPNLAGYQAKIEPLLEQRGLDSK